MLFPRSPLWWLSPRFGFLHHLFGHASASRSISSFSSGKCKSAPGICLSASSVSTADMNSFHLLATFIILSIKSPHVTALPVPAFWNHLNLARLLGMFSVSTQSVCVARAFPSFSPVLLRSAGLGWSHVLVSFFPHLCVSQASCSALGGSLVNLSFSTDASLRSCSVSGSPMAPVPGDERYFMEIASATSGWFHSVTQQLCNALSGLFSPSPASPAHQYWASIVWETPRFLSRPHLSQQVHTSISSDGLCPACLSLHLRTNTPSSPQQWGKATPVSLKTRGWVQTGIWKSLLTQQL